MILELNATEISLAALNVVQTCLLAWIAARQNIDNRNNNH
jgi:hypothetical protein